MKKILMLTLVILLMGALVIEGCATSAPAPVPTPAPSPEAAKPIKLICATWEGPDGNHSVVMRLWAKELEEKSNGRVKVEFAYGAVMGKAPEHYDLVVTSLADISMACIPFTPGRFPMAEIWTLPVSGEITDTQGWKAMGELYNKGYFDNDFRETKVLWLGTAGPTHLHMGKTEITTVDDIKGKKIRGAGEGHINIIKALGGAPVGLPATDVYDALQKGVIDGALTQWSFIVSFRTETVTKSITTIGVGGTCFVIAMSKNSYASLPQDIKAIIDEISPKYYGIGGEMFTKWEEEGKQLFLDAGGKINQFSAADQSKVYDAMAPLWQAWFADGDTKGLKRKQMTNELYNILKGWGVQKPFEGYKP